MVEGVEVAYFCNVVVVLVHIYNGVDVYTLSSLLFLLLDDVAVVAAVTTTATQSSSQQSHLVTVCACVCSLYVCVNWGLFYCNI